MTRSRSVRRPIVNGKWSRTMVRRSAPSTTTRTCGSPVEEVSALRDHMPVAPIRRVSLSVRQPYRRQVLRVNSCIDYSSIYPAHPVLSAASHSFPLKRAGLPPKCVFPFGNSIVNCWTVAGTARQNPILSSYPGEPLETDTSSDFGRTLRRLLSIRNSPSRPASLAVLRGYANNVQPRRRCPRNQRQDVLHQQPYAHGPGERTARRIHPDHQHGDTDYRHADAATAHVHGIQSGPGDDGAPSGHDAQHQ